MSRSFPPDVVVLDAESLLHVRLAQGKPKLRIAQSKRYRLPAAVFTSAAVTPKLSGEDGLTETLRRVRSETGSWQKVSLLLPDGWFRMNLLDLQSVPDSHDEALQVIRWSLKRTLPIPPEQLRLTWTVVGRDHGASKVLVLSAMEETLSAIERSFSSAGMDVILIEPIGLNIWNAVAVNQGDTSTHRLFLYVREGEFTTAVFRGGQPLFLRSRNLGAGRTLEQEIRLSASYLRDALSVDLYDGCWVAGRNTASILQTVAEEFQTQARPVLLRDFVSEAPSTADDAELTACTGVFTG